MKVSRERVAIVATLGDEALMWRVRKVAGSDVGDPLNSNLDSVRLRERYGLTVEYHCHTAWAFNDEVRACWRTADLSPDLAGRRATVIAVASMWVPINVIRTV